MNNDYLNDKAPMDLNKSIEGLSGQEFKFIRLYLGITCQQIADKAGKRSRHSVLYWEKKELVKSAHAFILKSLVSDDLWAAARGKWRKYKGDKSDLIKQTQGTTTPQRTLPPGQYKSVKYVDPTKFKRKNRR